MSIIRTFSLCFYLVLLVFLRTFDQTSATKVEIYLCFHFFILQYVFWKSCYGYHSNDRIDNWYVLESYLLCFQKTYTLCGLLYLLWSIICFIILFHYTLSVYYICFIRYRSMKGSFIWWRLENLQIEVLLIFFLSSFSNSQKICIVISIISIVIISIVKDILAKNCYKSWSLAYFFIF